MTRTSINPFKDDVTGRTFLGRYRIVRKLASGGMGVVYLARAEGAAGFVKPVVVKLILPSLASQSDFLGMFIREARILANLKDPGIVNVIDFAEERGCYIMVLEYVHGYQISEWTRFLNKKGRQIPTPVAIQIMINVLDSLHHAHNVTDEEGKPMQIIHRDISPTNIMIDVDGRTKLVDFGIALMEADDPDGYKTQNQSFKGKLSYAAPELFFHDKVSVQSDIFACGVTLHEILVGKNEFNSKNHATTMQRILYHQPSLVRKIRLDAPNQIDTVIQKALAKNPKNRYTEAKQMADALKEINAVSEREAGQMLTVLVQDDFNDEMAELVGVESLRKRDRAWRNPSDVPAVVPQTAVVERELSEHTPITISAQAGPNTLANQVSREVESSVNAKLPPPPVAGSRAFPLKTAIGIGVGLIALLGVGAALFFSKTSDPPAERKFLLVQSPAEADEEPSAPVDEAALANGDNRPDTGAPSPAEPEDVVELDMTEPDPAEARAPKQKRRKPKAEKTAGGTGALTAAFRKQKGKIRSCFKTHSDDLPPQPQISILFHLAPSGKVTGASLSPAPVTKTGLGKCILSVAHQTRFPSQASAISFRIPVTVLRVKG